MFVWVTYVKCKLASTAASLFISLIGWASVTGSAMIDEESLLFFYSLSLLVMQHFNQTYNFAHFIYN